MLAKLNKLTNWQAALIITVLGFAVYFDGLKNQFLGDDNSQIINNPVVHSLAHINLFFEGGTFYIGRGLAPLSGVYFRPLMTTVFSLLYSIFGLHPFYFHLFQLLLCIGSAILLYLFFRDSFRPALALFLALVFLLHPIDSQNVYAIACMQDALFFFLGILAIWLVVRFESMRTLLLVALSLLLSLFAKESGILFIAITLLYLFWFDTRKRLYVFLGIMALPIALYLTLKIHAIGLLGANPGNAPIDSLSLTSRLFTAPSILFFYISKFVLPLNLAHAYYWVYPTFSFRHFLLPLLIDIGVIGLVAYIASVIRKRAPKAVYYTFLLFAIWSAIGLSLTLQIIPLDMTVCETWFYFSMVGVLGMLGVAIETLRPHKHLDGHIFMACAVAIIVLLGLRTASRGPNWASVLSLSYHDVKVSREDYTADYLIAIDLYNRGKVQEAQVYAERSVKTYPIDSNNEILGKIYFKLGKYPEANQAYLSGIQHGVTLGTVEQLNEDEALLMVWYGNPVNSIQFIKKGLVQYPQDSRLWLYLSVLEYRDNNTTDAKEAISQAYSLSNASDIVAVHTIIMNNRPLALSAPN